jgi:hypothetical protein
LNPIQIPGTEGVIDRAVSHVSDSHRKLIPVAIEGGSMTTEDQQCVECEVAFPEDLLTELDEFRASHGYPPRSAVVAEALRE